MSTVHDGLKVHNDIDIKNSGISSITPEPAQRNLRPKPNQVQRISCFSGMQEVNLKRHMESKHESREERMEGHFHNEPNCKNDESEEDVYDIPDLELFEPSKREESEVDEDDDEESSESPSIAPEPAQRNLRPKEKKCKESMIQKMIKLVINQVVRKA